jgi:DNA-binding response OmpR family regulator
VLLVEDDRFLRKAAEATLRKGGFTVMAAADGEEALNLVRTDIPHLVLLDLIMPKIQGFEVLRRLKEDASTRHVPVIVLSNLGQDSDIQRAMTAGAAGYLIKSNLSLQDLLARVKSMLSEDNGR